MDEVSAPQTLRPRRAWLAFLLSLVSGGLGQLYAGAPVRAILALLFLVVLLPIGMSIRVLLDFSPVSVIASFVIICLLVLLVPFDAALTARRRRHQPLRRMNRVWVYVVWVVVSAVVIDTVGRWEVQRFWFHSFKIPSGAMMDTLLRGDYIFGDMRKSNLFPVQRGDIVLFFHPIESAVMYIKRVVGLPGEEVELRDGLLYVDGVYIEEPYINDDYRIRDPKREFGPIRVMEDHFFVLGDHRNQSADSRFWGQVPRSNLRGRARSIWWSYEERVVPLDMSAGEEIAAWARGPTRFLELTRWDRIGQSLETRDSAEP